MATGPERCEQHGLAPGPDGRCVICRRAPSHADMAAPPTSTPWWLLAVAFLCVTAAGALALRAAHLPRSAAVGQGTGPSSSGVFGAIQTRNSAGRTGAYYLPPGYGSARLPLLVAIHGTGGSGGSFVHLLQPLADRAGFIVVAPDSRIAPNGQPSWEVPSHRDETTADTEHVRLCVDEVQSLPGVNVDPDRVLVLGHSGGGSTAAYEASVDPMYSAFAVLHGGVFAGGLGDRHHPRMVLHGNGGLDSASGGCSSGGGRRGAGRYGTDRLPRVSRWARHERRGAKRGGGLVARALIPLRLFRFRPL